jgi:hypothetical protein
MIQYIDLFPVEYEVSLRVAEKILEYFKAIEQNYINYLEENSRQPENLKQIFPFLE